MKPLPAGRGIVIGSVNTDRILRCPVLPAPGETVLAADATRGFGGKDANQAVAAARMGAATHLVAKIGRDTEGEAALDDLRGANVETGAVHTDPDAPTGQAIVMVDPAGENSIVVVPGANARLTPDEVAASAAGAFAATALGARGALPRPTSDHPPDLGPPDLRPHHPDQASERACGASDPPAGRPAPVRYGRPMNAG